MSSLHAVADLLALGVDLGPCEVDLQVEIFEVKKGAKKRKECGGGVSFSSKRARAESTEEWNKRKERKKKKPKITRKKQKQLTGRDDAVRLPLPEGDLAVGLDHDVHGLSRGLGAHDALDGLDLGLLD